MEQAPSPNGVLLIDKEQGMTSHDVVAIARRALNIKKIGHCGTLDPMATGLLILVINKATKLQDLLMGEHKEYEGTLTLGVETSTQDAEGEVTRTAPIEGITPGQITQAFEKYTGVFDQIPPMVSAIKKDGVPLYKLARKGLEIAREPRRVEVREYRINSIDMPDVSFAVGCSKGFYVRSYAADIGNDLGCGAHLTALRRTRSGFFTLERSIKAGDLKTIPREDLYRSMLDLEDIARLRGIH